MNLGPEQKPNFGNIHRVTTVAPEKLSPWKTDEEMHSYWPSLNLIYLPPGDPPSQLSPQDRDRSGIQRLRSSSSLNFGQSESHTASKSRAASGESSSESRQSSEASIKKP